MAGFSLIKKFPGLSTLLFLELVLLLTVSYQIQVNERISLLEKVGLTIFGPIQELNHHLVNSVSGAFENNKSKKALLEENLILRETLASYQQLRTDLEEAELQNQRFRNLLDLPKEETWSYVYAEVIGATHRSNDYMITINRGSNDGLRRDYGVYCPKGVVGIVWELSGNYAKIMTANNPSSVIAAMIQDSRYSESYVSGQGTDKGSIKNFPNFKTIRPNDLVLTSSLDGIFPKGLHIGRVLSGVPSSYMFQDVEIEFSADFSKLEEVVVLIPKCPEATP